VRKGKFNSKLDGFARAKRIHMCIACRHSQAQSWNDGPCPSCRRVDSRQYFMSAKERDRAASLLLLQDQGKIRNLKFQPRFDLSVNGRKICTYVADSQYVNEQGRIITEDVKPTNFMDKTASFKIALFNAVYQPQTITFYR
jgi:hypothetical protein